MGEIGKTEVKGVQNNEKGKVANKRETCDNDKDKYNAIFSCRKGQEVRSRKDRRDNLLTAKEEELIKQN